MLSADLDRRVYGRKFFPKPRPRPQNWRVLTSDLYGSPIILKRNLRTDGVTQVTRFISSRPRLSVICGSRPAVRGCSANTCAVSDPIMPSAPTIVFCGPGQVGKA